MKCKECQENLSAMIDGEIAASLIPATLAHAGTCRECQQFLVAMQEGRAQLRAAAPREVPPALEATPAWLVRERRATLTLSLVERIRESLQKHLQVPVPLAASVALFCMLVAASATYWWLGKTPPQVPQEPTIVYMLELPPVEVHTTPGQ